MTQQVSQRQVGRSGGNVILDIYVLNQRIGALLEQALTEGGVAPAEYAVYSQLGIRALTPSELAERIGVKASTLSGHLATLQQRGHTRRVTQEEDRRSYRLELTTQGRERLEACRPLFRRALRRLYRHLDTDIGEVRQLLATIDSAAAEALTEAAR